MIRRLYVDNYRCLVNFEWHPGSEELMLGPNGSGKSSVVDALRLIRAWITGSSEFPDLLGPWDGNAWTRKPTNRFELDVTFGGKDYSYEVEFLWGMNQFTPAPRYERLKVDGAAVFEMGPQEIKLAMGPAGELQTFPMTLRQSVLEAFQTLQPQSSLVSFRSHIADLILVRPLAPTMSGQADGEPSPAYDFSNFLAWYVSASRNQRFTADLLEMLSRMWPDYETLQLDSSWILSRAEIKFRTKTESIVVPFNRLSDGERMLIALYSFVAFQRSKEHVTLVIDEPDNFLSSQEIQPWLLELLDGRPDDGQVILISHDRDVIETMGEKRTTVFWRDDHLSPTRIERAEPEPGGLPLSERVARGWQHA